MCCMTQNNQEQNKMKEKNSFKTGLKKLVGVLMASGMMSMAAVANVQAQDKAAFVYIGPTSDHGWTYSHDQGRIKAEKTLTGKYKDRKSTRLNSSHVKISY